MSHTDVKPASSTESDGEQKSDDSHQSQRQHGRSRPILDTALQVAGTLTTLLLAIRGLLGPEPSAPEVLVAVIGPGLLSLSLITLNRTWDQKTGWPADARRKGVAAIVALTLGAALTSSLFKFPWTEQDQSMAAAGPSPSATISPAPGFHGSSPGASATDASRATPTASSGRTSGGRSLPSSNPLRYNDDLNLRSFGFDVDTEQPKYIENESDDNAPDVDLDFNGAQLVFAKNVTVAPWSGPDPTTKSACESRARAMGVGDQGRLINAPAKGSAYCFIANGGHIAFIRVKERGAGTLTVALKVWR